MINKIYSLWPQLNNDSTLLTQSLSPNIKLIATVNIIYLLRGHKITVLESSGNRGQNGITSAPHRYYLKVGNSLKSIPIFKCTLLLCTHMHLFILMLAPMFP